MPSEDMVHLLARREMPNKDLYKNTNCCNVVLEIKHQWLQWLDQEPGPSLDGHHLERGNQGKQKQPVGIEKRLMNTR